MLERYKDLFIRVGNPTGKNISGWSFYDGSFFQLGMSQESQETPQDDIRTKNLLQKISRYHEGKKT